MNDRGVAVVSSSWTHRPHGEAAAAVRSIAGALTRLGAVDVFVPGEGSPVPDGAFDLTPVGAAPGGGWPDEPAVATTRSYRATVVEASDPRAAAVAAAIAPGVPVLSLGGAQDETGVQENAGVRRRAGAQLRVDLSHDGDHGDGSAAAARTVGLYARVDPAAGGRRHYGLRSIPDYVLVLGDRAGIPATPWPSEKVRWAMARFARRYVVVVEGGAAHAWRSRSCVAAFDVHTRMDLWILMARASGVVDLAPGDLYARECVEALRYGVPVAVPRTSVAAGLVRHSAGVTFSSTRELLECVELLFEPSTQASLGERGRAVADRWYGDPEGLVERLDAALPS